MKVIKNRLVVFAIGAGLLSPIVSFADQRIWLKDAKIDGKSVRLCFDSGCNVNIMSQQAVKRLGLKVNAVTNDFSPDSSPELVVAGVTEDCTLTLDGIRAQTAFTVVNFPDYVNADFDGTIGWYPSRNIVQIDATAQKVDFFSKVPRRTTDWVKCTVITNFGTLELEVPHKDHPNGIISIDTGSDRRLDLPPREWQQWKDAHPDSPITLSAFYTGYDGFMVREESWADQICIGSLVLTEIPITEEGPSVTARWGDKGDGTLGLAALERLNLIVDGKHSIAYLQPKNTPPPAYNHNRLGAVFVPTATYTNKAVARVVTGSPAYEAGIRNGDILLQVDDVRVLGWTADWYSRFHLPPGTKLHLILQRDGKDFETTATLRQIIPANTGNEKH